MTIIRRLPMAFLIPVMFVLAFFLMAKSVFAQDATGSALQGTVPDPAVQYNIVFPVGELGDCADMGACQSYCQDPVHANGCMDFAREHGFYVEDATRGADGEFLQRAEGVLGCDSLQACLDYCADSANHAQCDAFAR